MKKLSLLTILVITGFVLYAQKKTTSDTTNRVIQKKIIDKNTGKPQDSLTVHITPGASGVKRSIGYRFSSSTSESDPGSGFFRLNSTDASSSTIMFVDDIDIKGEDQTKWYSTWDKETGATGRGRVTIADTSGRVVSVFDFTEVFVDAGGYWKLPVEYKSGTIPGDGKIFYYVFERIAHDTGGEGQIVAKQDSAVTQVKVITQEVQTNQVVQDTAKVVTVQVTEIKPPDTQVQVVQDTTKVVTAQVAEVKKPDTQVQVAMDTAKVQVLTQVNAVTTGQMKDTVVARVTAEKEVKDTVVVRTDQADDIIALTSRERRQAQVQQAGQKPVTRPVEATTQQKPVTQTSQPVPAQKPATQPQQTTTQQKPVAQTTQPVQAQKPVTQPPQTTTQQKPVAQTTQPVQAQRPATQPPQTATQQKPVTQTVQDMQNIPPPPSNQITRFTTTGDNQGMAGAGGRSLCWWYFGIIEAGYGWGIGEFGRDNFRINFINGVRLGKRSTLGLGIGWRQYNDDEPAYRISAVKQVPVFVDFRTRLSRKKLAPYLAMDLGSSIAAGNAEPVKSGLLFGCSGGLWYSFTERFGIFGGVAFENTNMEFYTTPLTDKIMKNSGSVSLNIGISF